MRRNVIMQTIDCLTFQDIESGDNATVYIRADKDVIGLAISLEKDGDTEVFFDRTIARRLLEALTKCLDADNEI